MSSQFSFLWNSEQAAKRYVAQTLLPVPASFTIHRTQARVPVPQRSGGLPGLTLKIACQGPAEFSRWLEIFPPGQFAKNAAHRFLAQAGISVHNLGNSHARGEGLKNKRNGNACATHTQTASKVLRVSDNPVIHRIKLTLAEAMRSFGGQAFFVFKNVPFSSS
jgi:hypothetical protein